MDPAPAAPETCPACRKPVPADSRWKPFCSDRCRLVDLGRWFHEDYRVSTPLKGEEE